MKRKVLVVLWVVMLTALMCAGCVATEGSPPTQTADWFSAEVLPKLIDSSFNILLIIGLIAASFRKVRSAASSFDRVRETLQTQESKRMNGEEKLTRREKRVENAEADIVELKQLVADMQATQNKILTICKIATINNPYLVSNGYAAEIAKVVKDEKEETTQLPR